MKKRKEKNYTEYEFKKDYLFPTLSDIKDRKEQLDNIKIKQLRKIKKTS